MPELITLESVNGNFSFCVDFYTGRAAVRANTKLLPAGVALEEIKGSANSFCPGMVLMSTDWDTIYFLNIREEYRLDDYFTLAEHLMKRAKKRRA